MADTVRVTRDPEFFPFMEGYKLTYHHTSTLFEGVETVELVISDVRAFRDDATAQATLTRIRMGAPAAQSYKLRRNSKQVVAEGGVLGLSRMEFPVPPVPGKRWTEGGETHEIASVEGTVDVPAGKFLRCMRINTVMEGGSGIRYYAPGIGCVYEERSHGDVGSRVSLVAFELPRRRP